MKTKSPIEWARDHDGNALPLAAGLSHLLAEVAPCAELLCTHAGVDVVDIEGETLGTGPTAVAAIVDAVTRAYRREIMERVRQVNAIRTFKHALRGLIGDET